MCCTSTKATSREYKGTYSQYQVSRVQDEERLTKFATRQEAEIGRLSTLADKVRHSSAKRAKLAKSLDKRVDRLASDQVTPIQKARTVRYRFPEPPPCGRDVLDVRGLDEVVRHPHDLEGIDFGVRRGERLLVLGLNGAGKTTMLRILAGVEPVRRRCDHLRAQRVGRLLRAGARRHLVGRVGARPHARRRAHRPRRSVAARSVRSA